MSESTRLIRFEIEGNGYALPLTVVDRVIRAVEVTALPEAPAIVEGVIDMHGLMIPVISLRRRFHLPDREIAPSDHFIIAHMPKPGRASQPRATLALAVDEVFGVVEIDELDILTADSVVPGLEYVEGVTRVPQGILLIYDLPRCLSLEEADALDAAMEAMDTDG